MSGGTCRLKRSPGYAMKNQFFQAVLILCLLSLLFLIRKNTRLNLYLLVFFIPFEHYFVEKLIYGFALLKPVRLFAFTTFISMVLNKEKVSVSIKEYLPLLLIFLSAVLSLINAPHDLIFRSYQGSLSLMRFFLFFYFIAYTLSIAVKDEDTLKKVLLIFITACFLSTLIELVRAREVIIMGTGKPLSGESARLFTTQPWGTIRLTSFGMSPNQYSDCLMFALSFMTIFSVSKHVKIDKLFKYLLPVFFIFCFYVFILTFTRGTWLGYLIVLSLILWFAEKEELKKAVIRGAIAFAVVIVMLLAIYPRNLSLVSKRISISPYYGHDEVLTKNLSVDGSIYERFLRWEHFIELFKAHPVIGNGWGVDIDRTPHNAVLQFLAEGGLVGLGAFTAFASCIFIGVYKGIKVFRGQMRFLAIGIMAVLLGNIVHLMTDVAFYQVQTWFLAGIGLSIGRMAARESHLFR